MFGKTPKNGMDSFVGEGTQIIGAVHFSGELHVEGKINGSIIAAPEKSGTLILGKHAHVDGEIKVINLTTDGTITGTVYVAEHLAIQRKARITGDVYYKTLETKPGSIINGLLSQFADEIKWLR